MALLFELFFFLHLFCFRVVIVSAGRARIIKLSTIFGIVKHLV